MSSLCQNSLEDGQDEASSTDGMDGNIDGFAVTIIDDCNEALQSNDGNRDRSKKMCKSPEFWVSSSSLL